MPEELRAGLSEEQFKMISEAVSRSKSNTHRLDELEKKTELLTEMNKNIAVMAEQMKHQKEDLGSVKKDVEEMKDKPNKLVDSVKGAIIGAIATGVVGALMLLILK